MYAKSKGISALLVLFGTGALLAAGVAAVSMTVAEEAEATVPPRNCGTMTVSGKRFQIKADQIRCRTAKSHSRRYLSSHRRPSGYRCRDYNGGTKLKFRCWKGVRLFFAIRR